MQSLKGARLLFPSSSRLFLGLSHINSNIDQLFSPPSVNQSSNRKRNECFSLPFHSSNNYIPKFHYYSTVDATPNEIHEIRHEPMPKHVAVILDGNGRWAKSRGLAVKDGHRAGMVALNNLVSNCSQFGIKVLTVYAFSIENWKRSQMEVDIVMKYIENFIQSDVMELIERHKIRFSVIGNKSQLPSSLQSTISSVEAAGRANGGTHFVMAVNYGGRQEIATACKEIAMQVDEGVLKAADIDENVVERRLMTSSIEFPNPDLLIRTSGELRVSNFMLWQLAYTEFFFASKMFPDFGKDDLEEALASFQQRQRRYGRRKP